MTPFVAFAFVAIAVTGIVQSCRFEDMTAQLEDMRHEMHLLTGQLNDSPIGKPDVFAKRGGSHVTLPFRPRDASAFKQAVLRAAQHIGYFVPKDHDLAGQVVLCTPKSKYRSLYIDDATGGGVRVGIYATHPPVIGAPLCWRQ